MIFVVFFLEKRFRAKIARKIVSIRRHGYLLPVECNPLRLSPAVSGYPKIIIILINTFAMQASSLGFMKHR